MEESYSFVTINDRYLGCKKELPALFALRTNKQGSKIKLFLYKG